MFCMVAAICNCILVVSLLIITHTAIARNSALDEAVSVEVTELPGGECGMALCGH